MLLCLPRRNFLTAWPDSLSHELNELTVNAGETFDLPFVVSRSAKLPERVRVQLVAPPELTGLVQAEQVELSPTTTRGRLRVVASTSSELSGRWPLTIKATALQDGRWLVLSQDVLSVQFNTPSIAAARE